MFTVRIAFTYLLLIVVGYTYGYSVMAVSNVLALQGLVLIAHLIMFIRETFWIIWQVSKINAQEPDLQGKHQQQLAVFLYVLHYRYDTGMYIERKYMCIIGRYTLRYVGVATAAVICFPIRTQGRTLFVVRPSTDPFMFGTTQGKFWFGETITACSYRLIQDEMNITLDRSDIPPVYLVTVLTPTDGYKCIIFVTVCDLRKAPVNNLDEVKSGTWVSVDDIDRASFAEVSRRREVEAEYYRQQLPNGRAPAQVHLQALARMAHALIALPDESERWASR